MEPRKLHPVAGYQPSTQKIVSLFAAQFDDQLALLRQTVEKLTVTQLEWQPHPGINTVGMLLAHLAVVEVYWLTVAARQISVEPEGDEVILRTIGIRGDDDGLPLKPDGKHPATLAGKTAADYLAMLDKARAAVHAELRTWDDAKLEQTFKGRTREITFMWTLYHVLEHFAGHFGQILLLKHLMRDAGVLSSPADD